MNNVEDLYPLSPLQQGLLFHSIYDASDGLYFVQTHYLLRDLDRAAFKQAWRQVVQAHPALRTAFVSQGLDEPLQVVRREAPLHWDEYDWRPGAAEQLPAQLDQFVEAERSRGFNLTQAPLMRLALIALPDGETRFVWSFHHLLLDGWSKSLVMRDVLTLYHALLESREVQLKRPRPYHDYIAWLQQQPLDEAEQFWRRALRGFHAPTPLRLEQAIQRTAEPAERFGEQQIELSREMTAQLSDFARLRRVTLNTLAQAAWAILLSRYSGEQDVLFGAASSGRSASLSGIERMVGLFINTLPLRICVSPEAALIPWLQALQAQQAELRQYEYSPLVAVQGWSDVPRGKPLFESILVFESYPAGDALPAALRGLELREVFSVERTNYPLDILIVPGDTLTLKMLYDGQRFDRATIRRMLGHFQTLLQSMLEQPEQQLGQLNILTPAERRELVIARNATEAVYPREQCYHQLFEAQAARTPDAIAAVFGAQQLRYQQLDRRANQLAHHLRACGVGPGVVVGICAERSLEMIVALLGIFKAGGAFLPLDPAFPAARSQFMLEDAQARVLLTQRRLLPQLPERRPQTLCLDAGLDWLDAQPTTPVRARVDGDHLAYVIYTSGSTGRPKGVLIPHRGLVNYLIWALEAYTVAEGCGAPVHSSIAADAIFPSLFAPLLIGASVVFLPESRALQSLSEALSSPGNFSMVKITPTQLDVINQQLPQGDARGWVRTLVVGAEAVRSEVLAFWQQHAPDTILLNEYGPTETVVGCSKYRVPAGTKIAGAVPIGLPIANTQFYVLDAQLQPVPVGAPGELYIGGDGVAWGYLNRPDLTAEKFTPDPFSARPGARLYKTGDVVRSLPDRAANIEFLGRADHQVKIRGYRVEPGEIDSMIVTHPAVREAVVVAHEDRPGELRLVAYVAPKEGRRLEPSELRAFLQQRLPEYMAPATFVLLEALPLTATGKLDRAALPKPEQAAAASDRPYVAPRTLVEAILAAIWAQALGVARVGRHDDFFALGGHSLLATRIVNQVRKTLQVSLPLQRVFDSPTLAELATAITALETTPGRTEQIARAIQQIRAKPPADAPATPKARQVGADA
jgi:amino acid adenylation domain-containing protein